MAEAIQSALAQTWPRKEVIVVDDGSTDRSREVIRQFDRHIRFISIPHAGAPTARNEGIRAAQGEYIKFLDADDLLTPEAVHLQVQAAQSLPTHAIPYGQVLALGSRKPLFHQTRTNLTMTQDEIILALFAGNIPTPAPLHRASALREVGGFDADLQSGEEWDLHLRLALQGMTICYVDHLVCLIRHHTGEHRINRRLNSPLGVEWRCKSVNKAVQLIQQHYGSAVPPKLREVMGLHYHTLGRSFARWGQREKAEQWFQLARSHGVKTLKSGSSLYRVLRRVLGDYWTVRTLSAVHGCVLGSLPYKLMRKLLGNFWDSRFWRPVRVWVSRSLQ